MIKLKCYGKKIIISIWDVPGKALARRNGGLLFYIVWLRQPHWKRDMLLSIFTSFIVFELEIPHSSAFCPSTEKQRCHRYMQRRSNNSGPAYLIVLKHLVFFHWSCIHVFVSFIHFIEYCYFSPFPGFKHYNL